MLPLEHIDFTDVHICWGHIENNDGKRENFTSRSVHLSFCLNDIINELCIFVEMYHNIPKNFVCNIFFYIRNHKYWKQCTRLKLHLANLAIIDTCRHRCGNSAVKQLTNHVLINSTLLILCNHLLPHQTSPLLCRKQLEDSMLPHHLIFQSSWSLELLDKKIDLKAFSEQWRGMEGGGGADLVVAWLPCAWDHIERQRAFDFFSKATW
jgi:hypothetical protein